ncbi:pumilio homolog 12 isoform X2 [Morus notabilis]|uniref:pumilio homolog 12 isoform X1 n=1 Tax=Morus notabilis TaxID=981085 RepID=UPI000CED681C|nr:pumilio homolog 12 isoform X1 [Morus notabilis]XP_024032000.1 pumilio homolog 12 isoform X2 [Morus notabilis]
MEEKRSELEFDEFEKLLGEIPNATSGNPHCGVSVPKRVYVDGSLSPLRVNSSYKEPSSEKLQNKGRLDEGKNLLNRIQCSPTKGVVQLPSAEMNLPDDHSLTSAFSELSFKDVVPTVARENPPLEKSLQNYTLKKRDSNMDSSVMVVPSFRTPNSVPYGFYGAEITKVHNESANLSRFNPQELKRRHSIANCQPIESFPAAVPLDYSMHGFPFLSNVTIPGMQFPAMSDHQQLFTDTQAHISYLNPHQTNQHQISWSNMEEEQRYGIHQSYLHLQQFPNQQLEDHHLLLENGNIATRLLKRNPRQTHCKAPISHQYEQFKQKSLWNGYALPGESNQLNPAYCSIECNDQKAWEKVVKQSYHDQILARSHGLNKIDAAKFGHVGANESFAHVVQNGKVLRNDNFFHNSSNAGCYQFDSERSWDTYRDKRDFKSADLKYLPLKYNSLNEVTGRIYHMAKDQHGCRFLQRKFVEGTQKEIEMIFEEIRDHIVELMTDPFGNYLVQKLLEVCNEDQRMQILDSITREQGELIRISCDMHGTRAIQKVIETLNSTEQFSMVVFSLAHDTVALIKNMNGNHVAQRCLQHLTDEHSQFLFDAATSHCVELAKDRHGCCVLQKCLTYSDGERRRRLIHEIASNALILSYDQYGNYVVQFVFELELPWATTDVLDHLDGSYGDLSVQKYSSNVVEKILKFAGEENCTHVIEKLVENERLDQIMQDPFGNYVIQVALEQSKGTLFAKLMDAIKLRISALRTSPYGKKVLASYNAKK